MYITREQGLGFPPCLGQGLGSGRALPARHTADRRQEWSELNSAPQGTTVPGHGQDRATQPLRTSTSASPTLAQHIKARQWWFYFKVEQRWLLFFLEMQHSDLP